MPNYRKNIELEQYLQSLLGSESMSLLSAPPEPAAIRVNTLKSSNEQLEKLLNRHHYNYQRIPFNPTGYMLKSDPLPLSHSLGFFEGLFQYQGISSQLPAICLDVKPGERVLDLTAAPGSKSTQLAALMKQKGILILNDSSHPRLQALQANMQRCGAINFYIMKNRGESTHRLYPAYFDKILLDAPCSALGTLSSKKEVYSWWSGEKLKKLSQIQYQLLLSAIKSLKVGGILVYATCSIAPEENEQLIDKIIQKFPMQILPLPPDIYSQFAPGWRSYGENRFPDAMKYAIRIWPQQHRQEGFFIVKLKKTGSLNQGIHNVLSWQETLTSDHPEVKAALEDLSCRYGIPEENWPACRYIMTKSRLWMLAKEIKKVPHDRFLSAGLLLGEKKISGWKLVNASAQVCSAKISKRRISLSDKKMSILFREGKVAHGKLDDGYYILDYQGRALGSLYFAKRTLQMRLPHAFHLVI
jgi:NOL1/NOP2/sun family putative RNA methylase